MSFPPDSENDALSGHRPKVSARSRFDDVNAAAVRSRVERRAHAADAFHLVAVHQLSGDSRDLIGT